MLIICKEEAIDDAIRVLQGHFQVKDPISLEDYIVFKLCKVMIARKPGWDSQQLLRVWRNNLERELQGQE